MFDNSTKSTSSGYMSPEMQVVEMQPEGVLAASFGKSLINDMDEWDAWETV